MWVQSVEEGWHARWKDRVKEYMCERGAIRRGGFKKVREGLEREREASEL